MARKNTQRCMYSAPLPVTDWVGIVLHANADRAGTCGEPRTSVKVNAAAMGETR